MARKEAYNPYFVSDVKESSSSSSSEKEDVREEEPDKDTLKNNEILLKNMASIQNAVRKSSIFSKLKKENLNLKDDRKSVIFNLETATP